jgi:hypothetical protein
MQKKEKVTLDLNLTLRMKIAPGMGHGHKCKTIKLSEKKAQENTFGVQHKTQAS